MRLTTAVAFLLLADGIKSQIPYSSVMMVMRRAYIERNRETARNAVNAVIDGIHSYKANKEQTLKTIAKYIVYEDPRPGSS